MQRGEMKHDRERRHADGSRGDRAHELQEVKNFNQQVDEWSVGEFTVKVYTSKKKPAGAEQWRHISIRLQPLNPEFEAMEFGPEDEHRQFRVIAEFVRVLEDEPV